MTKQTNFSQYALEGIRNLQPYTPGKPIETLERELGISDSLKLASNENPLGASSLGLEALYQPLESLAMYPDGGGFKLKEALAGEFNLSTRQIILGNGSNDVLDLIGRCFLSPDRNAVFSAYAFAVYPIVTQACGAEMKIASANPPNHSMPYGHYLNALLALIDDQTQVVFIANPNNPTGTWLAKDELRQFLDAVPESVIVVVDEAYFEYVTEPNYPNTLLWLDDYSNLIVTRTFSKIYGLAALRVGYAVSHPEVADLLNRVRQPFNVNSLALAAATAAIADEKQVILSRKINQSGLLQWQDACEKYGWGFIPSVGNFICIHVGRDAEPVYEALLQEGVIVRPIANYGLPQHLRITIGTSEQNDRCIQALYKVLTHD
ncbi:MAG: histidinol-phosphate transaminase [Thiotrichaceae bacterium]|nr:histidinol-phosphate transaminase [Thiotrichaceae bacterium]